MIRVGSYTILPPEVEEIAMRNPKDEEEILEACKKELAEFKVPRKVICNGTYI